MIFNIQNDKYKYKVDALQFSQTKTWFDDIQKYFRSESVCMLVHRHKISAYNTYECVKSLSPIKRRKQSECHLLSQIVTFCSIFSTEWSCMIFTRVRSIRSINEIWSKCCTLPRGRIFTLKQHDHKWVQWISSNYTIETSHFLTHLVAFSHVAIDFFLKCMLLIKSILYDSSTPQTPHIKFCSLSPE